MPEPRLLIDRQDEVMVVTFNRPPRHFFDDQMSVELDRLTRNLRRDADTRVVVFTGTDDVYLTHADVPSLRRGAAASPAPANYPTARVLSALARGAATTRVLDTRLRATKARDLLFLGRTYAALNRLNDLDQVVITEINGLALAMGAAFALACDLRTMADDAHLGLTEAGLALLAGAGATQRLARAVGTHTALELLLEGRWIDAHEARNLHLVHHVRPRSDLHADTMKLARRVAQRSPTTTREIKRAVHRGSTYPWRRSMARETTGLIRTLTAPECSSRLEAYDSVLTGDAPLTDDAIRGAWAPLLDPRTPPPPSQLFGATPP